MPIKRKKTVPLAKKHEDVGADLKCPYCRKTHGATEYVLNHNNCPKCNAKVQVTKCPVCAKVTCFEEFLLNNECPHCEAQVSICPRCFNLFDSADGKCSVCAGRRANDGDFRCIACLKAIPSYSRNCPHCGAKESRRIASEVTRNPTPLPSEKIEPATVVFFMIALVFVSGLVALFVFIGNDQGLGVGVKVGVLGMVSFFLFILFGCVCGWFDKKADGSYKTTGQIAIASLLLLGAITYITFLTPNPSSHTDGVFESATKKLDNGEPLTKRESQRIDDIVNWCKICNAPLRTCPHGKK